MSGKGQRQRDGGGRRDRQRDGTLACVQGLSSGPCMGVGARPPHRPAGRSRTGQGTRASVSLLQILSPFILFPKGCSGSAGCDINSTVSWRCPVWKVGTPRRKWRLEVGSVSLEAVLISFTYGLRSTPGIKCDLWLRFPPPSFSTLRTASPPKP